MVQVLHPAGLDTKKVDFEEKYQAEIMFISH